MVCTTHVWFTSGFLRFLVPLPNSRIPTTSQRYIPIYVLVQPSMETTLVQVFQVRTQMATVQWWFWEGLQYSGDICPKRYTIWQALGDERQHVTIRGPISSHFCWCDYPPCDWHILTYLCLDGKITYGENFWCPILSWLLLDILIHSPKRLRRVDAIIWFSKAFQWHIFPHGNAKCCISHLKTKYPGNKKLCSVPIRFPLLFPLASLAVIKSSDLERDKVW